MLRLMQAGLLAGSLQAFIVVAATIAVTLFFECGQPIPALETVGSLPEQLLMGLVPFVTWSELATALGLALTANRYVDDSAARLRQASRRFHSAAPDHAVKALLVQLCIASAGFAALALRPPPDLLTETAGALECTALAALVWPGLMSIGVAAFGANAHVAAKAL